MGDRRWCGRQCYSRGSYHNSCVQCEEHDKGDSEASGWFRIQPEMSITRNYHDSASSSRTFVYAIAISNPSGEITLPNLVLLGPKATSLRPSLMPSHLG